MTRPPKKKREAQWGQGTEGGEDSEKSPETLKEESTKERGTRWRKIIQEKGIVFSETWKEETVGLVGKTRHGWSWDGGVAVGKPAKCAGASSWMGLESHGGTQVGE